MTDGKTDHPSLLAEEAGPIRGWLTRYFRRRVRNSAEVEDMVQEVFTRMVARDSTEPVQHLGGYIHKTASSVLTDRARSGTARAAGLHVGFDPDIHGEDSLDPERLVGARQELHAATLALLRLPERTRTVFILRRLEGMRFHEIASHLGISVSAVEKHMVRAIHQLSVELEKHRGP
jgi:RNA polymerase sigma-70 factor (ECF subfamily)